MRSAINLGGWAGGGGFCSLKATYLPNRDMTPAGSDGEGGSAGDGASIILWGGRGPSEVAAATAATAGWWRQ